MAFYESAEYWNCIFRQKLCNLLSFGLIFLCIINNEILSTGHVHMWYHGNLPILIKLSYLCQLLFLVQTFHQTLCQWLSVQIFSNELKCHCSFNSPKRILSSLIIIYNIWSFELVYDQTYIFHHIDISYTNHNDSLSLIQNTTL